MSKEIEFEDGSKELMYTEEDLKIAREEALEPVKKTIAEKEAEVERLKKISTEKTENFKRYNEMSEEEKKAYDANTTEMMKRLDFERSEREALQEKLTKKEEAERNSTKNGLIEKYTRGDQKTKEEFEQNYSFLTGMPETTPDEIAARAAKAAALTGIAVDNRNPLYIPYPSEAPHSKPDGKEFVDSDKGTAAVDAVRQALGVKPPEEKK